MAATEFTGAVSEKWNLAGNWDNGVPGAGDDAVVPAAKTCEYDYDGSGVSVGTVTIGGTVHHDYDADTHAKWVHLTISGAGEYKMGDSTNPIDSSHTCQLTLAVASDGDEGVQIDNGGLWRTHGSAAWNMIGESWDACHDPLASEAASGQAVIEFTNSAKANMLKIGNKVLLQGTNSHDEDERVEVLSKDGANVTLTANLTYTHAAGAQIGILSRNVIIRGVDSTHRPLIDNNNNTQGFGTQFMLTELSDIYYFDSQSPYDLWEYVTTHGAWLRVLTSTMKHNMLFRKFISCGSCGATSQTFYGNAGIDIEDFILSGEQGGYTLYAVFGFKLTNGYIFGGSAGLYWCYSGTIDNVAMSNHSVADIYRPRGEHYLNFCTMSSATPVFTYIQNPGSVYSANHGQVAGAFKSWRGIDGTADRQAVVTYGTDVYAYELTPGAYITASNPLQLPIGPLQAADGDTVEVSVRVRVNSTYGTDHDPYIELDPTNSVQAYAKSTQNITAADTWTELTATGTIECGAEGTTVGVDAVLSVPYYVSGGAVFVAHVVIKINGFICYEWDCSAAGPEGCILSDPSTTTLADIAALLGTPAGASVSADIGAVKTDTGTTLPAAIAAVKTVADAVQTVTDQFTFTIEGSVDATVGTVYPTLDDFAAAFTAAYIDMSGQMDDIETTQAAQTVVLSRIIGLCGENQLIDTTAHDDNNKMTSAQMRTFASAEDLGNEENELGTYAIAATYNDDGEMQTYQATLETP